MASQIQLRRDTAANWTSVNPTLAQGELGVETDTGKIKLGTGSTAWNSLSYFVGNLPGATLDSIGDVTITSVQNGDFLRYNGSASVWINDPVNLATDTVGNYVESLVAGTGVTLTNNTGEAATPTVAIGQAVGTSSSVTFANVTSSLTGNASTASALQTARSISLGGDLSGSASFDGSQNINITATVQPNSVALGTDTTGNYMSDLTQGTGVTITHTPGEGSNATIAIGQDVATSASVTFARLIVQGDMEVQGTITRLNETNLDVDTAFIYLNANSASANPDMGIAFNYDDGTYRHAGLFRDSSDGIFKVFEGYEPEPISPINTSDATYSDARFQAESLILTQTTGTAPMSVSSSTVVTNLNADKLDGQDGSYYAPIDSPTFTGIVSLPSNTVALGTQTTGNYVSDVSGGTGVTVTHTPGEGSSPTIAIGQAVGTSASVTFAHVFAPVTGNVTGNADTATALQTARVIALSGDVSGSVSFNGTGNVDISTTIGANSVSLGADTSGDYVSSLVAGTGVSLANNSGETATPTISIGQDVATSASVTFARLETTGNVVIGGNLTVNGDTTTLNTQTLSVEDNTVVLNSNATGIPTLNAGIEIERGDSANVAVRWNETNDQWEFTNDGTTYGEIAALGTIELGTDTTGNYVNDITAGTGVTVTHTPAEGSSPTIAIGQAVGTSSSVTFAAVTGPLVGNASTASALQTARAISLTGDVSGSVSFDGSQDVSISTIIQPNSIALGTDTTGNYVNNVVAGTGISVTHTPGEGSSASVALNATLNNLSDVTIETAPTYAIGDTGPAGGKIFITPSTAGNTTGRYFEAAPSGNPDVNRTWATDVNSNQTTAVSGADGTAIGTGAQNTIDIVAQAGNIAASSAAAYCADYTYGGFSDWFLPSKDELNQLYTQKTAVGGFTTTSDYWSSSEYDETQVWVQYFDDGASNTTWKNFSNRVRPVRSFTVSGGVQSGDFLKYDGSEWINDPINLGTDTVGNYMSDLTQGTGVTITHTPGEGSNATIAIGQAVATSSSVQFAAVTAPLIGNASTASTLQTARNISLTGDVSGSVSFDGSANASITATIQPNSVALGTDTTGNYLNDVTAGTGISVSHTPGEGSNPTISINATLDDLNNVLVSTPITGDYLKFNGSNWVSASLETSAITVSASAPGSPAEGDLWFDSSSLDTYIYYDSSWLQQNTPPSSVEGLGDLVDVLVQDATPLQVLAYNGTEWESTDIEDVLNANLSIKTENYTLVLSDKSKTIEMSVSSENTVTIPTNSSVPFPVGTEVTVLQYGTGKTQIVAQNGVTIRYTPGNYLAARYSWAKLVKRATNEWYIYGDLSSS